MGLFIGEDWALRVVRERQWQVGVEIEIKNGIFILSVVYTKEVNYGRTTFSHRTKEQKGSGVYRPMENDA
jgi:hypothetical protein